MASMNSSISTINSFGVEQLSRPQTRRESAKRHSIRANGWLGGGNASASKLSSGGGGGGRRGRTSRIPENEGANNHSDDEDEDIDNSDHDEFYDEESEGRHQQRRHGSHHGGHGGKKKGGRKHYNNKLLQMSISELGPNHDNNDDNITVEVSVMTDPNPDYRHNKDDNNSKSNSSKKNIYALGVLSPSHLEKQPAMKKKSAEISPSPASATEVVKVQFIQSGGKVIKVDPNSHNINNNSNNGRSPIAGSGLMPGTVSETPHKKATKKLSILAKNLLGSSKTPLVMGGGTSSSKSKQPKSSKYSSFAGDDTDQDDDDISGSGEINLQDSHDLNYDDEDDDDEDEDSDFYGHDNKKEGLLQREPRRSSWSKNDVIPVLQPL